MTVNVTQIDPDRLYSLAEARALIPGRNGGRVSLVTLQRWAKSGRFPARQVAAGPSGRGQWIVRGSDLLRFVGESPAAPRTETPEQTRKRAAEAKAEMRRMFKTKK